MTTAERYINGIIEKTLLSDCLIQYFRSIDDKCFDRTIIEATFTSDASIVRPDGSKTIGHDKILETNTKSFARFRVTQHVITDQIIDIQNGTATLQANLSGMHVWADNGRNPSLNGKHFHAGVRLSAKAVKVDQEWRFCELISRIVWRTGDGMAEMADFMKNRKID